MPSVGAIDFPFVSRPGNPPGENVREVTRAHVDGIALQKIGKQGRPFRMVAIKPEDNAANAQTAVNNIKDLSGTIVDIVDDHGITWPDVAILNVRIQSIKGVAKVAGVMPSTTTKIITVEFECQDTRTSP